MAVIKRTPWGKRVKRRGFRRPDAMKGNRFHSTHQVVGHYTTRHGNVDVWKFSYFADDRYNHRKYTGYELRALNRERGVGRPMYRSKLP
jgi:hypothetical protein